MRGRQEGKNGTVTLENNLAVPLKGTRTVRPSSPALSLHPREMKAYIHTKTNLHTGVHSSFVQRSPKLRATRTSKSWRTDKEVV